MFVKKKKAKKIPKTLGPTTAEGYFPHGSKDISRRKFSCWQEIYNDFDVGSLWKQDFRNLTFGSELKLSWNNQDSIRWNELVQLFKQQYFM